MERYGEITVECCKTKAGKAGIEILNYNLRADAVWASPMREQWEVIGRGVLARILQHKPVGEHVQHITFDFLAKGHTDDVSVFKPETEWTTRNEVILQGLPLEAWLRTNVIEGLDWWEV